MSDGSGPGGLAPGLAGSVACDWFGEPGGLAETPNTPTGRAPDRGWSEAAGARLAASLQTELQALRGRQMRSELLAGMSVDPGYSATDEELLAALAPQLVPALADWCVLYLVRIDGSLIPAGIRHSRPRGQAALGEVAADLLLDLSAPVPVLRVAGTGVPHLRAAIGDAELRASCRTPNELTALREVGMTSALAVPVDIGKRVVAVILLATTGDTRRYGDDDLAFAREIAARVAGMLDHARLRREVALSDAHAVARFKVAQAIDDAGSTGAMLAAVSQRIADAIGDGCMVRLLDEDGAALRFAAVSHVDPARRETFSDAPPAPEVPADSWLYRQALRNHAPIVLPRVDSRHYPDILPAPSVPLAGRLALRSLALAPLRRAGRTLGLLVLWRDRTAQPYRREDLVQLQELAGWISLAVDEPRQSPAVER